MPPREIFTRTLPPTPITEEMYIKLEALVHYRSGAAGGRLYRTDVNRQALNFYFEQGTTADERKFIDDYVAARLPKEV